MGIPTIFFVDKLFEFDYTKGKKVRYKMGRCDFSQIGRGMTQREAERDATASAESEYGYQEGYSGAMNCRDYNEPMKVECLRQPKPAKRCKVEKTVQKGTRKWVTYYVLYVSTVDFNEREVGKDTTQGGAIKKAKDYALKHNVPVHISIEKRLEGGSTEVAIVRPNKSEIGMWRFSGTARC